MKVAIIGMGSVGRGVAEMIAQKRLGITVTGIADSKSGRIDSDGIDLFGVLEKKQKTGSCGNKKISATDVSKKPIMMPLWKSLRPTHQPVNPGSAISGRQLAGKNTWSPPTRARSRSRTRT